MSASAEPALHQRRLRVAIRQARLASGLTQKEVADMLHWSPSKILRMENGSVSISITDLKALLDLYGVREEDRINDLVRMAQAARGESWVTAYKDKLSPEFVRYLGYESAASFVRSFQPLMMPGVLQTEEYARTVVRALSASDASDEVVEARVAARLERQELVLGPDGPEMHFILDEAVLLRRVGRDVAARQLAHLKKMADHPRVILQVLPLSIGEHPGMMGPFVLLEFPDGGDDDILYLESSMGDVLMNDAPEAVIRYKEVFFKLEDLATPKARFGEMVDAILREVSAGSRYGGLIGERNAGAAGQP